MVSIAIRFAETLGSISYTAENARTSQWKPLRLHSASHRAVRPMEQRAVSNLNISYCNSSYQDTGGHDVCSGEYKYISMASIAIHSAEA